ncbi:MAG: hypothetical protein Kow0063_18620 [Anaerolineae bacterium]
MSQESIYVPGETYTSARATPELVGREKELKRIEEAIRDTSQSYIIYITGEGGIGKTRLVKHILEHPPDGLSLTAASDLIDLYHTRVHSLAGLIGAILGVLKPLDEYFQEELKQVGTDKWEEVARAEQEGFTLAEIISRRKELTEIFITAFNRYSDQQRVILALDTTERLQAADPTQEMLGLTAERPAILNWLLNELLPNIRNTVVLLAGRPEPGDLTPALKRIPSLQFLPIPLGGLTEQEALAYFEAVAESARASGDVQAAEAVQTWSEEERKVIFHCLCDEGEPPRIRPILLALAIDHLVVAGRPLPALTRPLAEAQALTSGQRKGLQAELGSALVQTLHEARRPADEVIIALGWLRKGADADLLARITGLEQREVEEALEQIKDLSFVKVRPADARRFLHDEMYDLLQQHRLDRVSDAQRERVFKTLQAYYDERIDQARAEIAKLYRPLAETALPQADQVIIARGRLQDALVEDLYYRLRRDAAQGFQTYFRYAEEAVTAYDESLDMQLQAELLGFLAERDPSGQAEEVAGLRRGEVLADAAVRWIKRLISDERYNRALKVARRLRAEVKELVVAGGDLAKAELDAWEAVALAYTGELDQAEELLEAAVTSLEGMKHSHRWAGILARAYNNLGYLRRVQGRYYGAATAYEKALPLWRATKIEIEQANTLNNRAFALSEIGQIEAAWQQAWDGLELRERLGPRSPVGLSLNTLAHIKVQELDLDGALLFAERALTLFDRLGSERGRGLALKELAEAERRISDLAPHFPVETAGWLAKAAGHAKEAECIFREKIKEPSRLVEALIEVGCAYRDWAKFRRVHPNLVAEEEKKPGSHAYSVQELAERSQQALLEAADLAKQQGILYRQVDALVNLGWLRYYTELYAGAPGFDQAQASLEKEVLTQVRQAIPGSYRITERRTGTLGEMQGGLPTLLSQRIISSFLVQLGKLELLYGQIAFNRFLQSGNQDIDALKEATEHYTLSLAYDTLFSDQIFRDMRRGMDRMYERMKLLNPRELGVVYDTVLSVEEKYGLGESRMRKFLRESFGPRELLLSFEL